MGRGLSLKRFREWREVVRGGDLNFWGLVEIILIPITEKRSGRARWRKRMIACLRCPAYIKRNKTCVRCGCYLPYKAAYLNQRCPIDLERDDGVASAIHGTWKEKNDFIQGILE